MTIQTGSITSPTKKSAAANEVRNRLEIVLRDLFLKINHRTIPFPTIVSNPATPNHVAKAILPPKVAVYLGFPKYVCRSFLQRRLLYRPSVSLLIKNVFWLRIIPNLERYLKFIYGTSAVYSSRYSWL